MRPIQTIELSLQHGGHTLALELHAFLRDADRIRNADFMRMAEARLDEIATAATELVERMEKASAPVNAALLQQLESLRATIGEYVDAGLELRRELDELVVELRGSYEALASALREDALEVPQLRPTNYLRNVFHVSWSLCAAGLIALFSARPWALVAAAFAFALSGWSMEISRRYSPALNAKLLRAFRHFAHPHEAHQVNSSTWYATALALLALTREPTIMMLAVLVLGFADPAAAIIGRRFGRIKLVNWRTLEGSLTFTLVGALAAFAGLTLLGGGLLPEYALGLRAAMAVSAGLCGAVAELFSRRIDDNFSIPVASALGAWLLLLLAA